MNRAAPPTTMRRTIVAALIAATLGVGGWWLPQLRRAFIRAVTTFDAIPSAAIPLPAGSGPALDRAPRTRVILIDGLARDTAIALPTWSALCARGTALDIDVGFPTVSLPVEVALWTGLTQQQSGVVYRSGRPIVPPLVSPAIPPQVPGSVAIAESYGYIVRSLGFQHVEPAADPARPAKDVDPEAWAASWQARAQEHVAGPSPLVFVHVLRVDTAGHKHGIGAEYAQRAAEADAILGSLHASASDARWFLLSDHGHLSGGGHGGEERSVRTVQGCIVGPGIGVTRGGPVHLVDVARALADSTGVSLAVTARGRPLAAALAAPLGPDQAVPATPLAAGALAIFLVVAGLALSTFGVRRWWLVPWWFVVAIATFLVVRGVPTLSTPMIYKPEGRDMYLTWLPALLVATVTSAAGARRLGCVRTVIAQLAVPLAACAAAITACGAWPTLAGAEVAPVVPRFTAWASPLILVAAHGLWAVALGVLASVVPRRSDRSSPPAPPRSAHEGG